MVGLIIAVVFLLSPVVSQDDPCINNKMLNDDGGRSSKCSLYHPYSHDRFITEGWRRVQLESTGEDLTMPTECVPRGYCGSHSNVWLNGTHPTVEDGIVDRMGCLSMFSSCCQVQYPIQIKNCTDYMVYNLKRTLGSDERYCFGDSSQCYITSRPTTVSSATTKTTTEMTRPTTETQRPTTKTQRQTTKTPRPTTKTSSSTSKGLNSEDYNRPCSHDKRSLFSDYRTDEMVTILAVCLSITIALLITLVFGIFFYLRQRKVGPKYKLDTETNQDLNYSIM